MAGTVIPVATPHEGQNRLAWLRANPHCGHDIQFPPAAKPAPERTYALLDFSKVRSIGSYSSCGALLPWGLCPLTAQTEIEQFSSVFSPNVKMNGGRMAEAEVAV
jgi:hypothetical protein